MKKPYYDSETKETYRYFNCDEPWPNFKVKFITGTVVLGSPNRPTTWYNEIGQVVKTEPFVEYVRLVYDRD